MQMGLTKDRLSFEVKFFEVWTVGKQFVPFIQIVSSISFGYFQFFQAAGATYIVDTSYLPDVVNDIPFNIIINVIVF